MSTLKAITPLQWLGIILIINGALIGSAAQLTDLFGPGAVRIIVAICSIGNSVVGGVITFLTGQGNMVRTVAAMPGVDSVNVNSEANKTLAQLAVSGAADARNISATPASATLVAAIAKSGA